MFNPLVANIAPSLNYWLENSDHNSFLQSCANVCIVFDNIGNLVKFCPYAQTHDWYPAE
jgi:hypothetical protein